MTSAIKFLRLVSRGLKNINKTVWGHGTYGHGPWGHGSGTAPVKDVDVTASAITRFAAMVRPTVVITPSPGNVSITFPPALNIVRAKTMVMPTVVISPDPGNVSITFPPALKITRAKNMVKPTVVVPPVGGGTWTAALISDVHCNATSNTQYQIDQANRVIALDPDIIFLAGDPTVSGSTGQFTIFNSIYGSVKNRIVPTPGNHDWSPGNLTYWFNYFGTGTKAHPPSATAPWYSFDFNGYHIVCLSIPYETLTGGGNPTSASWAIGTTQYNWLVSDLADNSGKPLIAVWHAPRYSEDNDHGDNATAADVWELLRSYKCDVIVNGHVHVNQRFAPHNGSGTPTTGGPVEFTSFGSNNNARPVGATSAASPADYAVGGNTELLVPFFTFSETEYSWSFRRVSNNTVTDSGTKAVHNPIVINPNPDRPFIPYTAGSFLTSPCDTGPVDAAKTTSLRNWVANGFMPSSDAASALAQTNYHGIKLNGVSGNKWGMVFAIGKAGDPIWKLTGYNTSNFPDHLYTTGFHGPTNLGTLITGTSDSPMVVIDPIFGFSMMATKVTYAGGLTINVSNGNGVSPNLAEAGSAGSFWHSSNGLDAGNPRSTDNRNQNSRGRIPDAITIRKDMIEYGIANSTDLGHVLHLFLTETKDADGWCHPMTGNENRAGWGGEGWRLRLRSGYNVETSGASPAAKVILRTIKKYGMIIGDNAGGVSTLKLQQDNPADPWGTLLTQDSLEGYINWSTDLEVITPGWQLGD